jgi:hypothetical protein
VAKVDREIDALYQSLPGEFTASRNALAKSLTGDAVREVRSLKKPTVVPWAVNQVFWKSRPIYDRLMEKGHALRTAQVASLKGRKSDVRAAIEAHRRAVGEAVHRAEQIASTAGLSPDAEQLARMFEAISLAATPPSQAGRFTEVVAPQGFEALAGVTPVARAPAASDQPADRRKAEQERQQAEEAKARIEGATREVERAQERVLAARKALKQAESDLATAQEDLESSKRKA